MRHRCLEMEAENRTLQAKLETANRYTPHLVHQYILKIAQFNTKARISVLPLVLALPSIRGAWSMALVLSKDSEDSD